MCFLSGLPNRSVSSLSHRLSLHAARWTKITRSFFGQECLRIANWSRGVNRNSQLRSRRAENNEAILGERTGFRDNK